MVPEQGSQGLMQGSHGPTPHPGGGALHPRIQCPLPHLELNHLCVRLLTRPRLPMRRAAPSVASAPPHPPASFLHSSVSGDRMFMLLLLCHLHQSPTAAVKIPRNVVLETTPIPPLAVLRSDRESSCPHRCSPPEAPGQNICSPLPAFRGNLPLNLRPLAPPPQSAE